MTDHKELAVLIPKKGIKIDFNLALADQLEEGQDLSEWGMFYLHKKRVFLNLADDILSFLNYLLNEDTEFAVNYLVCDHFLSSEINKDTPSEFIRKQLMCLFTDNVKTLISDFVEERYEGDLDEKSKTSNRNEELQFTDAHSKSLIKSSIAMKITAPLIVHSIFQTGQTSNEGLFVECFLELIDLFSEGVDIKNKIFKMAESRVRTTQYSDRAMWSYLENKSIDVTIITSTFFRKLIVDLIPKLKYETNAVSFLHAALKNQLNFTFYKKFPLSYRPINPLSALDDDDTSPFDKFSNVEHINESLVIINKLTINQVIDKLEKQFGEIEEDVLQEYAVNLSPHYIQENLTFMYISSKYMVGQYRELYSLNRLQYTKLVIYMNLEMRRNNLLNIAEFILAIPIASKKKRQSPTKVFVNGLLNSKPYQSLINRRFTFAQNLFVTSGMFVDTVGTMTKNTFSTYDNYYRDDKPKVDGDIEFRPENDTVARELITFINLL